MYARQLPVQTKVYNKNAQLLAVAYDMFFSLFKQFLETEMTWSQPIIVGECIFKNQDVCFTSC